MSLLQTFCCCGETVSCWYGGEADISSPPLNVSATFLGVNLPSGTPYGGNSRCAGAIGQTCRHGLDQTTYMSTDRFPCFGGQYWNEPLECTAYIPSANYLKLNCNSSISEGVLPYSVTKGELPVVSFSVSYTMCCSTANTPCYQSGGVINSSTCDPCFGTYDTTGVPSCVPTQNNSAGGFYIGRQSAYPCWERVIKDIVVNNWVVVQTGGDSSNTVFNADGSPAQETSWVQVAKITRPANGTGYCNTEQMQASIVFPPYYLDAYHGGVSLSTKASTNTWNNIPNLYPVTCTTTCGWFYFEILFGQVCPKITLAGRGSINAFVLALQQRFVDLGFTGWTAELLNDGNHTYLGGTIIGGRAKSYDIDQVCNTGKGCQMTTDSIHGNNALPIRCTDSLYQLKVTYPDANTIILWSRPRFYATLSGTVEHQTRCSLMKKGTGDCSSPCVPSDNQFVGSSPIVCLNHMLDVCGSTCPNDCGEGVHSLAVGFTSNPVAITGGGILNVKEFGVNTYSDQGYASASTGVGAVYADGFGCATYPSNCDWCVNGLQIDVS